MIPGEVFDELYGVTPPEFVATRTRLANTARDAGDRETATAIGDLRKPTVAAWAVNQLVRERPVEVERLLDVGHRMRAAQAELDAAVMRDLRRERDAVLDSFTRAARFVADAHGQGLSIGAEATVRSTGVAALADETAAQAVADGALVRTLDYAGFGEVDLSDAVAAEIGARLTRPGRGGEEAEPRDGSAAADGRAPGDSVAAPPNESETVRKRRLAALQEELGRADQELARASLVEAEQERLHEKSARRVAELTSLLEAARSEAQTHADAAADARREREEAAAAHELARQRLAEETRRATSAH